MLNPRTICRDCIFAKYEGNTQIDCSLNKLEQLASVGANILEVIDETEKEFYVIDGIFCMWCRNPEWAKSHKTSEWLSDIEKEMRILYQVIIWANDNIDDLRKTVESAVNQTVPPKHITVIRPPRCKLQPPNIISVLNEVCVLEDGTPIQWRNQNCIDNIEDTSLTVDDLLEFVGLPYYGIFNAGYEIHPRLFEVLGNKINNEMFKFAVIEPDKDGNGYIASTSIHKFYVGNVEKPLLEKIRDDECYQMIYPIEKLLHSCQE